MNLTENEVLYYGGVGARSTPLVILRKMTEVAEKLQYKGYHLRSGYAKGADTAWEEGAGRNKQIFKPASRQGPHDYPTLPKAYEIAGKHHVAWEYLPDWHKDLIARNVHIVLGSQLDNPSEFLLAWTEDGIFTTKDRTKKSGGTGHTIEIACEHGIPVFNLNNKIHYEFVCKNLTR